MLSVVVPSYNEEQNISRCLEALVAQKTDKEFEVILVDNNSTDRTVELAHKFENKLDLKIVTETKKGRSPARRKGFDVAQGEIVFSTDADSAVPANWIENLVKHFDNPNVIAITGTCYISDCDKPTNKLFNIIQPASMHLYSLIYGHYWLSGFSFAIRKSAYQTSGGFDPELNAQEDIDLGFRVSKLGQIKFAGNAPVLFSGRRFKNHGLIGGIGEYITSFNSYRSGKKNETTLSDIR